MKQLFYTGLLLLAGLSAFAQKGGDFYQISMYQTASQAQTDSLSAYLQNSYVPRLHKAGFKTVGVFTSMQKDASAGQQVVVWVPMKSLNDLTKISLSAEAPKYTRLQNVVLSAFPKAQQFKLPHLNGPRAEHIFELRSYEGPTEERYLNKVKMFNVGDEVSLFARLNFNAVFYAHVLAGSRMPNLMYMTSFDNQAAHDAHWNAFNNDPQWKQLSGTPEYKGNVSKADIMLLHPTAYSDVY